MIASNYRKHPQAMALQLPLPFGRLLVWHVRPTTAATRALRAVRGQLAKAIGRIVYPQPKAQAPRARDTRRMVQASLLAWHFEPHGSILRKTWHAVSSPAWCTRYPHAA